MNGETSQNQQNQPDLNFVVTGQELFDKNLDSIPCLVDPILPKVGVVAMAGSSDTGKSSLLRQLATSLVLGKHDFLGFRINSGHKKVLYINTEDDESAIAFLLRKQNPEINTSKQLGNLGFIFDTSNILKKIHLALQKHKVDCVIIDAFADLFVGDMNQSNKVRSFLHNFTLIAERNKCLVIFLHHTGKRTEDREPSKNNLLGSQGFEAKMRMVIELRRDLRNPTLRHFCIVKGNYLPEDYKNRSFVLRFDNNLCFTNTGMRTPFERLARTRPENQQRDELVDLVLTLHQEGLRLDAIIRRVEEEGMHVARSTAHSWIQRYRATQTGYGYADDNENLPDSEDDEQISE